MKVIAQNGLSFLVLTTDSELLPWSRAVVVDMDGGATVYPVLSAHSILARLLGADHGSGACRKGRSRRQEAMLVAFPTHGPQVALRDKSDTATRRWPTPHPLT